MRLKDRVTSGEAMEQFTALLDAVRGGETSKLQSLIDEGADVSDWRNLADQNLLHYAFDIGTARILLEHAPDLLDTPDDSGITPFYLMTSLYISGECEVGFDLVTFLLERAANLNVKTKLGETVLSLAVSSSVKHVGGGVESFNDVRDRRRRQVFDLLAGRKDFLNKENVGFDVLERAVALNYVEEAKVLIERRGDAKCVGEDGRSLLHSVVRAACGWKNKNPYHWPDYRAMVSLLISKGVDPNATDLQGRKPVDLAFSSMVPSVSEWFSATPVVEAVQKDEAEDDYGKRLEAARLEYEDAHAASLVAETRLRVAEEAYRRLKAEKSG